MGRGGPGEPQIARAGSVTVKGLLELLAEGHHAASDYLEDALTSGVTTVGARRVGGGLAGAAFATNAREAARLAVREGAGLVILEGSGAAVPPLPWDAGVLVAPAGVPEEYLRGYLGPYRLLRSDLVLITMASGPKAGPEHLSTLKSHVHRWHEDARFVVSDFEPVPLGDVRGKTVFLTTTAPEGVAQRHVGMLEASTGCKVVGLSARLADRAGLAKDLQQAGGYEVLLTELKAAAVDIACRAAIDRGAGVVFLENRAVAVDGHPSVSEALADVVQLAVHRRSER
jgi:cyclic 2,3-diphosphoglycerate synthetase